MAEVERVEAGVLTARGVVMAYVDALSSVGLAMRAAFPSVEQLADVLDLVRARHEISRTGEFDDYSYSVHGAGCLLQAGRR
ncbi:DUF6896 domain-containing protein [Streptomyces indicus]|uniref:DUF6896 domain-containing protein n=1 Tax=Streptomyces indicus TaxID=417292 RepID=UPI001FE29F1C|nr:hypothetical protein [Streptomyces indicus]